MAEESMIRETLHDMEDAALERASGMSPSDRAEFKECVAEVRRRVEAYKPAPAPGAEAAIEEVLDGIQTLRERYRRKLIDGDGLDFGIETLWHKLAALRGEGK